MLVLVKTFYVETLCKKVQKEILSSTLKIKHRFELDLETEILLSNRYH